MKHLPNRPSRSVGGLIRFLSHKGTAFFIVGSAVLLLPGCAVKPRAPIALVCPVDQSDQTRAVLLAYATNLYRTELDLSDEDLLRVIGFAHDFHPIYSDQPIVGRSSFNERVASRFIVETPPTPGTRPELVLEDVAGFVAVSKQDCFILVQTDGGIEDRSAAVLDRLARSLRTLAASPRFRAIAVVGLSERHRISWERLLAPLGDRAIVRGRNDAVGGITRLRSMIREERQ